MREEQNSWLRYLSDNLFIYLFFAKKGYYKKGVLSCFFACVLNFFV